MKKIILLFCLLMCSAASLLAQIKPAQSIVVVERLTYTPNQQGISNIKLSLNYKKTDNSSVRSLNMFGTGRKVDSFFVVEDANKPMKIEIRNSHSYSYTWCPGDPPPGPIEVSRSGGSDTARGSAARETPVVNNIPPPGDDCEYYYNPEAFDMYTTIDLRYPFFDTTIERYGINPMSVRIRVLPWLDNTNNLPSHDFVMLTATGTIYNWEFSPYSSEGPWQPIPSNCYRGSNAVQISGQDLFGQYWQSYHNTAVYIRASGSGNPQVLKMTHRISAPKILSWSVVPNTCWGGYNGGIKVKFNRSLLSREQLNLFLDDTAKFRQFSSINIKPSELNGLNEFTWKNELPASTYLLSMIGRYFGNEVEVSVSSRTANGQPYLYRAVSSIEFLPGFESTNSDNFETELSNENSSVTYTGNPQHYAFIKVTQPPKIEFLIRDIRNVWCRDGNSGKFRLSARGGSGIHTYLLYKGDSLMTQKNFVQTVEDIVPVGPYADEWIDNLKAGTYYVSVRDNKGCMLYDSLGNELRVPVVITEPAKELMFDLLEVKPVTSNGATNGEILINLVGGTVNPAGFKYSFEWKDSTSNQTIHSWTLINRADGIFSVKLANLPGGVYLFNAYDNKYDSSANYIRNGCTVQVAVRMINPLPLTAAIVDSLPISCYGKEDGQLLAKPAGGHQIDSLRYLFKWFKVVGGNPVDLNVTDSVLSNIGAGVYQVQIRDKYDNTVTSQQYTLNPPAVLAVSTSVQSATCYSSANGSAWATASGGIAPYTYSWSNGDNAAMADSLVGNKYIVLVRDARGCEATQQAIVTSPVQVIANKTVSRITCAGKCDGSVSLSVSGGQAPYTYSWNTGATGTSISNLCPGRYWYTVTDANGCFTSDTVDFVNPAPITLNAGVDRKICVGQTVRLDATVAGRSDIQYSWQSSNGYTNNTALATITQAGSYIVTIQDSLNCIKKDTVVLTPVSSTIQTEFLVSTQTFVQENVVLLNISQPMPDSVHWLVPNVSGVSVSAQNRGSCELRFADSGRYNVTMRAFYSSGCIDEVTKPVIVSSKTGLAIPGTQAEAFLKFFRVYPNPNNGQFNAELQFNATTKARLRMVNVLSNAVVDDRVVEGASTYTIPYSLGSSIVPGTYVLVIETAKGNFVHKVVIL
ncbi:T9SS type A sorting domain-containing protein [Terrimonas sp. NA20]|uniref:T9SS type A sorting domain-containing protein n=1 Tax=Terrimonas ginsenosidimutans TaxID=2908004 RepID=A0ABS9KZU1_9BACT|nr:T9SS type A sorting domain-containing protein [Terrimonas ginsenosidimutans]MCG2617747.1 T9SS type A sorting domain-containing protein [Terrimonas ginsenosidimutans]